MLDTKHECRIPMRDGVWLYTAVYAPTRLRSSELPRRDPYIFVFQDVRGSFMSEGKFVDMTPHIERRTARCTAHVPQGPPHHSAGAST